MSLPNRAWRATVWSRDGVPRRDWRFRGVFRFVLPVTDLLFLWFGAVGWNNGIQSVQDAAGDPWQTAWSAAIAVCAAVCFVGVAIPRLWAVELLGKVFLIGLVSGYVALYLARGVAEPKVTATAGLIVILILLPIWRVGDLSGTARQRLSDRRRQVGR